jgi:DNA-binding transcriptional ArsR family regulator
VQRIHFSVEDLAKVRLLTSLGPQAEAVFALDLLGHTDGFFAVWNQRVHGRLGSRVNYFKSLARSFPPVPELLWLLARDGDDPQPDIGGQTREQIATSVDEFTRIAIAPYWDRVRHYLEAERATRGRILSIGGVEQLLCTMHSRIRWNPPILTLPWAPDSEVFLDGRGLLLVPSLFLSVKPGAFIENEWETGQPVLVFPAPPEPALAAAFWTAPDTAAQPLPTLIGRTRAAVLRAVAESCTTSELAKRLGISQAGASHHTTVLRNAGLIASRRHHNTVMHTLTPLGMDLLLGRSPNDSSDL